MRRPRFEIVLAAVLVAALVGLYALRPLLAPSSVPGASRPGPVPGVDGPPDGSEGIPGTCATADVRGVETAKTLDLRGISAAVEEIRELEFREVPRPTYLSQEEFARRVRESVEYPPERADLDARILAALGAVPEGFDLAEELTELLEEQVAGFYDTEERELVVPGRGGADDLEPFDAVVLAHELEHALADQVHGLPDLEDVPPPGTEDARAAAVALIEGDATVTMTAFATVGLNLDQQLALAAAPLGPGLADAPHYIARSLMFPYVEGSGFVCALYADGGWAGVDRAYADPPDTTAEVLFPERYRADDEPADPRDPAGPPGWEAEDAQAVGAADLLFLFEAPGDDRSNGLSDPRERAGAWGGGEVHAWTRAERTAVGVALVEHPHGDGLCDSVASWYRAAFPDARPAEAEPGEELAADGANQDAVLVCAGKDVRLGIGPDMATARAAAR